MTLRMSKVVGARAEEIAKSALWAAASRVGVPIILGLIMTGIPAHLLWANRVNEELLTAKRDIAAVVADVKEIKEKARADRIVETQVQTDLATVSTNVAAILRSIDRIERQVDAIAPRR